ncbi:MAG: 50S ribosomal protein L7ae [Clostridiales bacterium]|nr:50S ribosomal protein L7ae [Clostridiales bacterium]
MNNKIHAALGFAIKSGKMVSGEFAVNKAVTAKKVFLIVVDTQASERTKKRWKDAGAHYGIEYVEIEGATQIVGQDNKIVIAITGKEFSDMILKELCIVSNNDTIYMHKNEHGGVY